MKSWRPRGITLDFYGTVVEDDDAVLAQIHKAVAEASPLDVAPEEVASTMSRSFQRLFQSSYGDSFRLQRDLELTHMEQLLHRFKADLDPHLLCGKLLDHWSHPRVFPESRRVLAGCDLPLCLVSNIDNADLDSALAYTGLSFSSRVTSEDCLAYKPKPEMWIRALSSLGLGVGEVLHVGDSYTSDVVGASSMGIHVLWVNRRRRQVKAGGITPDYESNNLSGLLEGVPRRL